VTSAVAPKGTLTAGDDADANRTVLAAAVASSTADDSPRSGLLEPPNAGLVAPVVIARARASVVAVGTVEVVVDVAVVAVVVVVVAVVVAVAAVAAVLVVS